MDASEGCAGSLAGDLVRRVDRRPAGAWIRDAWLEDEVLAMTARQFSELTGERCPILAALESGGEVVGRVYELPAVIGDRLRAEGFPVLTRFRLTADDGLELA